mgnify:CR=1 FL=1|jgi:hypothetical protein
MKKAFSRNFHYVYENYDGGRETTITVRDGVITGIRTEERLGGGYIFLRSSAESMDSAINELLDIVQDSKTPIKECAFTQDLLTALDGDAYIIHRLPVYLEKRMARLRKEADLRIKDLREELEEALKYRYVDLSYKYHDMA